MKGVGYTISRLTGVWVKKQLEIEILEISYLSFTMGDIKNSSKEIAAFWLLV